MTNTKTVFASAARTATATSERIRRAQGIKGLRFFLDITAASGTSPTLDITIRAYDPVGGDSHDVPGAAFAQKTTTGQDMLTIYPGIAETANESVSDVAPMEYEAVATIGGTTPSFTFTLSVEELA